MEIGEKKNCDPSSSSNAHMHLPNDDEVLLEELKKGILGYQEKLLPSNFASMCRKTNTENLLNCVHHALQPAMKSFLIIEKALQKLYELKQHMSLWGVLQEAQYTHKHHISQLHLKFLIAVDARLYTFALNKYKDVMMRPGLLYQNHELGWFGFFRRYAVFSKACILSKLKPFVVDDPTIMNEEELLIHFKPNLNWPAGMDEYIVDTFKNSLRVVQSSHNMALSNLQLEFPQELAIPRITSREERDTPYIQVNPTKADPTLAERALIRKIKMTNASREAKIKKKNKLIELGKYKGRGRPPKGS